MIEESDDCLLDDHFHDQCGVFGIWGAKEASNLAYLGLHALQHRGQESAGIVSSDGGRLFETAPQANLMRPPRHLPHPAAGQHSQHYDLPADGCAAAWQQVRSRRD